MNWCDITKKNVNKIEVKKDEKVIIRELIYNPHESLNFKNVDDEFDHKYHRDILNISFDFKNYISKNYFPFLNKMNTTYNIFDFVKDNSNEYIKTISTVKNYNNELIKEYEQEQIEFENECIEEEED